MSISYPNHHRWNNELSDDIFDSFGKNRRSRLRVILGAVNSGETSIAYRIVPLDNDIVEWFTPLYTKTIAQKNNAKIFDIRSTTIGKDSPYTYFALVLEEAGVPVGATIFSEREDFLSIAYRVHPADWKHHSFQTSPSVYTEFVLMEHAYNLGFRRISHGRDRNPYGLNSDIGLCVFKLSVGCVPSLPEPDNYLVETLNCDELTVDTLVLHLPNSGTRITEASLFVCGEITDKIRQVTRYPKVLTVTTYSKEGGVWTVQSPTAL
jgi:hypothetical protein